MTEEEEKIVDDSDEELGDDYVNLVAALQRTRFEDNAIVNKSLLREKEVINEDTANEATLKYLEMEVDAARYKDKYKDIPIDYLEEQISQQKSCLINRDASMLTIQNLYTHGQILETRNELIESSKSSELLSPELTDLLESSSACFQMEKSLNEVMEENYRKKAEILSKRKRLVELQKSVTALWQKLETKELSEVAKEDSDEVKSAKEKLKSREARLHMMVHYIVTLITCLSGDWARHKKNINILRACERFSAFPAMTDFDEVLKLLYE